MLRLKIILCFELSHAWPSVILIPFLKQAIRASLIPQLVKNPPAMRKTWVQILNWEDPLEKGKATHPSILA